jgi:protein-S-isoprenylcysteine O-methyltransferase Ste14
MSEGTIHSLSRPLLIGRCLGVAFGIGTQLLFAWTVVQLFLFLRYGGTNTYRGGVLVDVLLSVGFAIPHSILLAPQVQQRIKKRIPAGLLGCIHCSVTCVTLLLMFCFWGRHPMVLWQSTGIAEIGVLIGFYGSWLGLFYSLYLTGMGYQTGLTQWWYWLIRQRPPQRIFVERGAYRWMRHPIYMSFLGLIWFTPTMTLDHAVLTVAWTIYIYAGSYFKDQRMFRFLGEQYREYASRVPGLPIIGFGPLLKVRSEQGQIGSPP